MTYKEEEGQGQGFSEAAVCFSQPEDREEGPGGAKLKICLSECCLATALLRPIRVGRGGVNKGAGLKDVITLSRVELRVIGVRHDAAVLTIVHLGR